MCTVRMVPCESHGTIHKPSIFYFSGRRSLGFFHTEEAVDINFSDRRSPWDLILRPEQVVDILLFVQKSLRQFIIRPEEDVDFILPKHSTFNFSNRIILLYFILRAEQAFDILFFSDSKNLRYFSLRPEQALDSLFSDAEAFDILFFGKNKPTIEEDVNDLSFGQKKPLTLHFPIRKSWSCRCSIFRIKTHSTSCFSGRTIQHFEEAVDILFLGQKKLSIFYFRTKNAFHILLVFRPEQALDILRTLSTFYFSDRKNIQHFIFRTEQAVNIMCFQNFSVLNQKVTVLCLFLTALH